MTLHGRFYSVFAVNDTFPWKISPIPRTLLLCTHQVFIYIIFIYIPDVITARIFSGRHRETYIHNEKTVGANAADVWKISSPCKYYYFRWSTRRSPCTQYNTGCDSVLFLPLLLDIIVGVGAVIVIIIQWCALTKKVRNWIIDETAIKR